MALHTRTSYRSKDGAFAPSSCKARLECLAFVLAPLGCFAGCVWEMLDKKGNSNSCERMDLLDRFHDIFPDAQVAYLTGDREFVGKQWLTYLLIEPIISFRLRIRKSDRIFDGKKELRARTRMRPSRLTTPSLRSYPTARTRSPSFGLRGFAPVGVSASHSLRECHYAACPCAALSLPT